MTRSGFVVMSLGAVVLVAAAALGVLVLQPAQPAVGPLPPEALALPGDSSFVMGLDVKRLVSSPFYQKQVGANADARLDAFKELQKQTGLDPEHEVSSIVFTGKQAEGSQTGVAVVLGSFDEAKLKLAVEKRPGVTHAVHESVPLYSYTEGGTQRALAIVGRRVIVLGHEPQVRATLLNRSHGTAGIASNQKLVALLKRVKPGVTFWMVGDQSVLQSLPKTVPAPGAGASGGSLSLPALKQLLVSGDVDPQLAFDVTGDTEDEAGAKGLADMLKGFIALFSMQASQKPELAGLASAFNVTQTGAQVNVAIRISPELLEALQRPARPATP